MMKVLMVFYSFGPLNSSAAIPNTKLVKYLAAENIDITLITSRITPSMTVDAGLLPENVKRLRRIEVGSGRLFSRTLGKKRDQLTKSGTKLKMKAETKPFQAWAVSVLSDIYFSLRWRDWAHNARVQIRHELKGEHFDLVYSSYPSTGTHSVAQYVMARGMAGHWIADFRDPMAYAEYDRWGYRKSLRQQHRIERRADHITIVSEGAREKFAFADIPPQKITYIPNGFDPDDYVPSVALPCAEGRFRIFYAGTLYAGKRDLTVLFRAISELVREGSMDAACIDVSYAGNEWPILMGFAEQFGLADCCTNYGYITRTRVMELMAGMDCTVVCSHNTVADQGVVTGKVFELLLAGKPILAIITGDQPDSELGRIVRACEAGIVYEQAAHAADYETLKQWLKRAYEEKMTTGAVRASVNVQRREAYSYRNIAHSLFEVMERVTG